MFKKEIKKIAHLVYELGYHESRRINHANKIFELRGKVVFANDYSI